jgi:hypothetical protein
MLRRLVATSSVAALIALTGACGGSASDGTEALDAELAAKSPYPTAASCDHPKPDDCSFYRACLEKAHPCGDEGYAIAYGERLCSAFIEKKDGFSSDGQRWLHEVRSCLQKSLVPLLHEKKATCEAVLDEAYATHPGCYTAVDNSICALPTSDVLELASILGDDLYSERARAQIAEVAHTCVLDFFGFLPVQETKKKARHAFFSGLEAASRGDADTLRAFVAREGMEKSWVK